MMHEAAPKVTHATRIAELAWRFLLLAACTCAAKLACLAQVYPRNVGSVLDEMAAQSGSSAFIVGAMIAARDIQQSFLAILLLLVVAAPLSHRLRRALDRTYAGVLLCALAANQVAFVELGAFVSSDVVVTAWGWLTHQPHMLRAYTPWLLAFIALLALWILLPEILARAAKPPLLAALLIVCSSVPLSLAARSRFFADAFPLHGYWANVLRARAAQTNLASLDVPPKEVLLAQYRELAALSDDAPSPLDPEIEARIKPRHVLIVGLETAPRALYPLASPTFAGMREAAIVSDRHYTTSPYTRIANFSMLSGTYAPPSGLPVRFGRIACDGVAAVLRGHGYETSYIDAWVLDWLPGSGERAQAEMLGFDTVLDSALKRDDGVFEVLAEAERVAFETAFDRIKGASKRGHKAAVFIGTMLGHAPFPAAQGDEALGAIERVQRIERTFDALFAHLLQSLAAEGLTNDVIILVTGDHGLRLQDEFRAVGERYAHSDLAYNVPFLLYAPGVLDRAVRVPYPTSHVDITPTLLHLVGVSSEGMLHHGAYVLDRRLAERRVFLSSSKLGPIDGFLWRDHYVTQHALSGVATGLPPLDLDPAALLEAFEQHTNAIAATMLRRGAERSHAKP